MNIYQFVLLSFLIVSCSTTPVCNKETSSDLLLANGLQAQVYDKQNLASSCFEKGCDKNNMHACYEYAAYIHYTQPEEYKKTLKKSCDNGFILACEGKNESSQYVYSLEHIPNRGPASSGIGSDSNSSFAGVLNFINDITAHPLERAAHKNEPLEYGKQRPFIDVIDGDKY